ncbi:MAG: asparagine synthase (glutamine-hydrolyzing) [Candidatus Omnitrophica bacterium]|nr:asparagine synthase (glutamine-hydrolyzing) [Candidatus Omnitrophota bacterium]
MKRMVLVLRHRGPEGAGLYVDSQVGLGHARLSIIDLAGGDQPIYNEDKSIWTVYNGEIFNYPELREDLIAKGHCFATHTDTEVIVHLYEEKGLDFVRALNGQFALAIWDKNRRRLVLCRDRVGICPLYFTRVDGALLFASEAKALFMDTRVSRSIDPQGLNQLFTFWSTVPPQTVFQGIQELAPAHLMVVEAGSVHPPQRYWQLNFDQNRHDPDRTVDSYAEEFLALLKDAIKIRLRADVPVAAYLSGGIDSSFITALIKKYFNNQLETFSVAFSDKDYDESPYQQEAAHFFQTKHHEIRCGYADIGATMEQVVWHAEMPMVRTAPAPLFLLSGLVRQNNIKVVLTGEGADEILAGYDLFREMKIRRFWARQPESKFRPGLLRRLYHYLPNWPKRVSGYLELYYKKNLRETDKLYYSHVPKWTTTEHIKSFFSESWQQQITGSPLAEIMQTMPGDFSHWQHLSQAQYLEMSTLLSGYLLSAQGDRMLMAHSVEGRFPFLDHRVMEFCATIPPRLRLNGMKEKYLLKQAARDFVPAAITQRVKQGYRAPESAAFFNAGHLAYLEDVLSENNVAQTGYFNPVLVRKLIEKCRVADPATLSARDAMAVVGIITTVLVDKLFVRNFCIPGDGEKIMFKECEG